MPEDLPANTTSVLLIAPGEFNGLTRLLVYGDIEGLLSRMRATNDPLFEVERIGRRGGRTKIWLNPSAIAYVVPGPPLGEIGVDDTK